MTDDTNSYAPAGADGDGDGERVYYVDAFSGHLMTPQVTLDFLALFAPAGAGDRDAHRAPPLQVCSSAALFVRMYRNLMNLYQNPDHRRPPTKAIANGEVQLPTPYTHYEMEAHLHHSASQILELMRLSGENSPDVLTQMFIERFRYVGREDFNPSRNEHTDHKH